MRFNSQSGGSKTHDNQSVFVAVIKGLVISIATVVVASSLLSVILASTSWLRLGTTGLLLVNYLSIAIGGVYGSRLAGERGWLVGLSVGALYGILALLIGTGVSAGFTVSSIQGNVIGLMGAIAFGALAGMVGVNLK